MLRSWSITFRGRGRRAASGCYSRSGADRRVCSSRQAKGEDRSESCHTHTAPGRPRSCALACQGGVCERDQRKLEARASPDYIRVRQDGLPLLVGRIRDVSDRKRSDPWEWATAVREGVVSAGGAWRAVSEQDRADARGRAFDHWQRLIARGPDPAAIDVAPALAAEVSCEPHSDRDHARSASAVGGGQVPLEMWRLFPHLGSKSREPGPGRAPAVRGALQPPSRWLGDRLGQASHCSTPTQDWPPSS